MPRSEIAKSAGAYTGATVAGYRIGELVGEGGMATVYRATDARGELCAIKFLRKELSENTLVRRFLRETKLAATLANRHLVPVLDAGVHEETPYLVMPLLEGTDVGRMLARVQVLPPTTAVRIAVQACKGLAALHRDGVVHRDVKPTNILLGDDDHGEVVVKICDFGIAKALTLSEHSQLTQTGVELGSPLFMSPEQARDSKHVDERSDIWSLAMTLYKMLCGNLAYEASEGLAAYLLALTNDDPTHIQDAAPWVDPGLAVALHRGLERDPRRRWRSAEQFADALRPHTGDAERLTKDMIRPIRDDERAVVAARASLDRSVDAAMMITTSPSGSKARAVLEGLIDHELGGKYRVVSVIGRGGMGAVLEVRTPEGASAAAKVIDREQVGEGEQTFQRFLREAKSVSSIQSAHVVRTLDVGHDVQLGAPYIVMELLSGVDLGSLIKQSGPIVPEPLVRAFIQAGRGIAAAHARGIVHRDIKPANLFAHHDAAAERVVVKVCDFGIAKRSPVEGQHDQTSHELTHTGGMLGSPMYMSPEQAVNAKNVDHRSDIWSFAISLYEGLTGKKVWGGRSTLGEIILAICTHPIPPLRSVAPWIDPGLAEVVHRGLESDPEKRWQRIDDMIAALEPHAGGSLELAADDLRGVAPELRAQVITPVPPAPGPPSRTAFDGTRTAGGVIAEAAAKARASRLAAGGIAAALALVAAVGWLRLRATAKPSDTAELRASAVDAPAASIATTYKARVHVAPDGVTVKVDGAMLPIEGGFVALEGKAGQTFDVIASTNGAEEHVRVVLSSAGEAVPDRIEVRPPADDTKPKATAGTAPTKRPKGVPEPIATSAAAASAAAPAGSEQGQPKFKDTW